MQCKILISTLIETVKTSRKKNKLFYAQITNKLDGKKKQSRNKYKSNAF